MLMRKKEESITDYIKTVIKVFLITLALIIILIFAYQFILRLPCIYQTYFGKADTARIYIYFKGNVSEENATEFIYSFTDAHKYITI